MFKNDMESLGVPKGINGEGELRGQLANPGSPGKMVVKTECVCVISISNTKEKKQCGYQQPQCKQ